MAPENPASHGHFGSAVHNPAHGAGIYGKILSAALTGLPPD